MEFKTQKNKAHYFKSKYNSLERFISYFYQIDLVSSLVEDKAKSKILEVGVGSGMASNYLKTAGFSVVTCDLDKSLNPDYVADIRQLPFGDGSFSVVTAFEVLEHIPFEELDRVLTEINRVSSKYVVISLPYRSTGFEFVFKFPGIRTLFKRNFLGFLFRIPLKFGGFKTSGQHYWEIDGYNYRLGKVMKILKNNFKSVKKVRPVLDNFRLFFILEK
ncbi:MAG: class I SAM-dependent methyltransferase [bacterium]|nr:class I SAM-dependent methyltransferase [bacterium]